MENFSLSSMNNLGFEQDARSTKSYVEEKLHGEISIAGCRGLVCYSELLPLVNPDFELKINHVNMVVGEVVMEVKVDNFCFETTLSFNGKRFLNFQGLPNGIYPEKLRWEFENSKYHRPITSKTTMQDQTVWFRFFFSKEDNFEWNVNNS